MKIRLSKDRFLLIHFFNQYFLMKKLISTILLYIWSFLSYGEEDPNQLYILSRPEKNVNDTEIEIESPFARENLLVVFDNEKSFNFSVQAGYGNIFTSSSFMNGTYLGLFIQYENGKFNHFLSFQAGIRGNIYFADNFGIGDRIYILDTGICTGFPIIVQFTLFETGLSKTEKKLNLFAGINPQLFEIYNPLFILNIAGGISYLFYKSYYLTAGYEHSLNRGFAVNEVNVGFGYKF